MTSPDAELVEHPAAERIRAQLSGKTGRAFWRSLDEIAETPAFRAFVEAEFPSLAPAKGEVDRRSILKVMAASFALAGLTGCDSQPDEQALPYVEAPEFLTAGIPKWYATAVTFMGYAQPVLGKTQVGRPVKLEGNPEHPLVRGVTDAFTQAALLGLYDPDRSQSPQHMGRGATWDAFDATMVEHARAMDVRRGEGLRLLTGQITSPTLSYQIDELLQRWPQARWHVLEPLESDTGHTATAALFGRPLDRHLRPDLADVVVALDDDLLGPGANQIANARRWGERRSERGSNRQDLRLFVAEPTPSITGVMAEDRLVASTEDLERLARAIAFEIGVPLDTRPNLEPRQQRWLSQVVGALTGRDGRCLFSIGSHHSQELQILSLLINGKLGAFGQTLRFTEPVAKLPMTRFSPADLALEMNEGQVVSLVMLGVNPVYDTPIDLDFGTAMQKVPFRLHAGLHYDETAALSQWHVPLQHELESWSDARAVDGTASIVQPLIKPLYTVRSLHGVVDNLGNGQRSDRQIVQDNWRKIWGDAFEGNWRSALYRGFVADSAAKELTPSIGGHPTSATVNNRPASDLIVLLRGDPTVWDGRFANISWLQELPKPLTKLTWGNAVLISPQLANEKGLSNGDEVRVEANGRWIAGPVWIMPGQEARTVTLTLGYGRSRIGKVAQNLGYNAYLMRQSDRPWQLDGATIKATGKRDNIASTQLHQAMDGFDFVRTVLPSELVDEHHAENVATVAADEINQPTLFPQDHWDSPSWGMSIDLDLCIGCNACVISCVAENNIPMVGKELVAQGREMFWLRVDHYFEGDPAEPKQYFQPVPCMHCEKAPCEMGCPVNAAVHSPDGMNLQVYNRCVGTRTCASFCPYKVRHFNWFDYTGGDPASIQAMRNPEVTVRDRGVMEKCTYCIQRVSAARINAKKEDRPIAEGEVVTACQQACPTRAIVFGNVVDLKSAVSKKKASQRNYSLLEETNTRPRTTYLARIERDRAALPEGKTL